MLKKLAVLSTQSHFVSQEAVQVTFSLEALQLQDKDSTFHFYYVPTYQM